jgi:ABC-type nitrate/sulfonate/bicarbonate transport system ATPase subunit
MELDPTFIMVTHDINEAVYLSNEIIIMDANPGRIVERVEIDLPYTNSKIKRTKEFVEYVAYIEDIMMNLK